MAKKKCKTCKYGKKFSHKSEEVYCDYLCMTYHRRGCPADKCDKYEKFTESSRHFSL